MPNTRARSVSKSVDMIYSPPPYLIFGFIIV
jgi:hypothetical protein